jgi:hypothetical protein
MQSGHREDLAFTLHCPEIPLATLMSRRITPTKTSHTLFNKVGTGIHDEL